MKQMKEYILLRLLWMDCLINTTNLLYFIHFTGHLMGYVSFVNYLQS